MTDQVEQTGRPEESPEPDESGQAREIGPIDYLVLEFPGNRMTGEAFPLLLDLVDRGLIRIIDFLFVRKDEQGATSVLTISDVDGDGELDLGIFEGASSGLLDAEDIDEAGGVLENNSSGAVLLYENVWAAPLAGALRRSGGRMVASGRIPLASILEVLDAGDAAA
jgi:hypothetical protein